MKTQPSLWTIILTRLLRAPRKWQREGEQEKAEPSLRKSCRSPGSSPESTRKNLTRNMERNRRELTNSNSTVSFFSPCHNWLYIGCDREMTWSTTQCARILFCTTILPLRVFLMIQVHSENKYGNDVQSRPSQGKLFSGSLAAVKTVSSINFFILNPLLKGHPLS